MTEQAGGSRRSFRDWPRAARLSSYAAVVLVLTFIALTSAAFFVVRRPLPQTDGSIRLTGLTGEVTVIRDGFGVPHLYADEAEDLFYGQGFVQAQDRFWQMDAWRHITAGRLSELVGEDALEIDKFTRTMGWRAVAEQEIDLLDADTVANLEAFSRGVTEYIRSRSPGELSVEYSLLSLVGLDYEPEEWTPVDSLAWLKAMAWDLQGNVADELERATLATRYSEAEISDLFPAYPYDEATPVLPGDDSSRESRVAGRPAAAAALDDARRAFEAMPELIGRGDGIGSNAWAVSGEHTATGLPLLANDPHLAPSVPGIWYQMGLHCNEVTPACPYDVAGFTFAGVPGVIIGHNRDIAWALTNLEADVADLFLERIDGIFYDYDGGQLPLRQRVEEIDVLGRDEPFRYTVRETTHGPLMSDVSAEWSTAGANAEAPFGAPDRGNGYAVAISWTGLIPARTMDALFAFNRASDFDSFRAAAADFAAPCQNLVYADRTGTIAYQAPGLVPIRKRLASGAAPAPGWDKRYDWTGRFVDFEDLPSEVNPDEGFIVAANQAVVATNDPYLGNSWDYGYRSERIRSLLERSIEAGNKLTVEDMTAMQLDDRSGLAPVLMPYLRDVDLEGGFDALGQRVLRGWDFTQPADSAPAAYFNAVYRNILSLTFHDDLPEDYWPQRGSRWWAVVARLLEVPGSEWWDDAETEDVVEDRDTILAQAMLDARDELIRRQDRDPELWEWGRIHRLELRNQVLGESSNPVVTRLLNRGGMSVGGGDSVVNANGWDASSDTYEVIWAPSMRMVIDLADFDASRWVNLTGASGHATSEHYTDQTDLWLRGETWPFRFTPETVEEAGEDVLLLRPDSAGS